MRKILEFVSLAALALLVGMTTAALAGAHRLPDRVPTHFDAAGQANAWGSPRALLALPIVALALYVLMTVVSRHPSVFNFPVRVTSANRSRLEGLALEMIAWLKAEVLCLFAWIQSMTIELARSGQGRLSPWFMPVTLGAVFATIVWYVAAMRRAGRALRD